MPPPAACQHPASSHTDSPFKGHGVLRPRQLCIGVADVARLQAADEVAGGEVAAALAQLCYILQADLCDDIEQLGIHRLVPGALDCGQGRGGRGRWVLARTTACGVAFVGVARRQRRWRSPSHSPLSTYWFDSRTISTIRVFSTLTRLCLSSAGKAGGWAGGWAERQRAAARGRRQHLHAAERQATHAWRG